MNNDILFLSSFQNFLMRNILLILVILTLASTNNLFSQYKNTFYKEPENIKISKLKCQELYYAKKFQQAAEEFIKLSEYYDIYGDKALALDYRNKAFNCKITFLAPNILYEEAYRLLDAYNKSNLDDNILGNSIINNVFSSLESIKSLSNESSLLNFITDTILKNKKNIKLMKVKEEIMKLDIAKRHNQLSNQFKYYLQILSNDLPQTEHIKYIIDFSTFLFNNKFYQQSNILLFSVLKFESITIEQKAEIFNTIGNNYLMLGKLKQSKLFYDKSLNIRIDLAENSRHLRVIYTNLASYYSKCGKLDSSLIYNTMALKLSKLNFGSKSQEYAFDLNNRGNYFLNFDLIDSAKYYYNNSLEIKLKDTIYNKIDIVHSLYNLGTIEQRMHNYPEAIAYYKKSISKNFDLAENRKDAKCLASPEDYIFSNNLLGDCYKEYSDQKTFKYLIDSAKLFYKEALTYNDSIISTIPLESAMFSKNMLSQEIIDKYLEIVFSNLASKSKLDTSFLINMLDMRHNYILFNELIINEFNCKKPLKESFPLGDRDVNNLYNHIENLEENIEQNISQICELSKELTPLLISSQLNIALSFQFKTQLSENFSIKKINQFIDNSTCILEFNDIDGTIFCLLIGKDKTRLIKIGESLSLKIATNKLMQSIQTYDVGPANLKVISNYILNPLKSELSDVKKIIIVKDDKLLPIPFDILMLDDGHYLIEEYDISYVYSLGHLIANMKLDPKIGQIDFLGIAPDFKDDSLINKMQVLPYAEKEISEISKMFIENGLKAIAFKGNESNIENLQKFAPECKILHISTHSILDNNNLNAILLPASKQKNKLKSYTYFDVLNLPRSPSIVILASCSSNSGKYITGEGLQNLTRAFILKGAKTVIYSLYKLNDEFSYDFLTKLYKNFFTYKNISRSINETKRFFLRTKKYSHPTYWSNFQIIGI